MLITDKGTNNWRCLRSIAVRVDHWFVVVGRENNSFLADDDQTLTSIRHVRDVTCNGTKPEAFFNYVLQGDIIRLLPRCPYCPIQALDACVLGLNLGQLKGSWQGCTADQ